MRRVREALVLVIVGAAACGGGGTEPPPVNGGPPVGSCSATSTDIDVRNNSFSPRCTKIAVNATVTWTWGNNASNGHNVTFATAPNADARTTGTFQRTFPTAGTFNYECTLHPGMTAEIRVE